MIACCAVGLVGLRLSGRCAAFAEAFGVADVAAEDVVVVVAADVRGAAGEEISMLEEVMAAAVVAGANSAYAGRSWGAGEGAMAIAALIVTAGVWSKKMLQERLLADYSAVLLPRSFLLGGLEEVAILEKENAPTTAEVW